MSTHTFRTLAGPGTAELRIRGSSFLAIAAPCRSEEEARAVLDDRARRFHDATHNCSAWLLRGGVRRANDDGEPSSSAGVPILAAIEGAGLLDCMVVVTRYFGGTRLGVGGLIRAYGDAASEALAAAPRRTGLLAARLQVRYPYGHTAAVMRLLESADTYEVEHGYATGGTEGEVSLSVPLPAVPEVSRFLSDATAGDVVPTLIEQRVIYTRSGRMD